MNELENIALATGTYNDISTTLTSEAVVTYLVDGLSIVKVADRGVWIDGNLTYTITITNETELAFEAPVITDFIDPSLATLVDGTVTINGTPATPDQYSFNAGTLTVTLTDVAPSGEVIVEFQVTKV